MVDDPVPEPPPGAVPDGVVPADGAAPAAGASSSGGSSGAGTGGRRTTGELPPLPPGYVWVQPAPYEPPPAWRVPRWLKITTVAWAVALVAAAVLYSLHGRPSVREQTSIGNARPVVDTAAVDVVLAAGPDPTVAVSAFASVGSCRITAARPGASFGRTVDLYTKPGTEPALLRQIVAGLPARYHAGVTPGTGLGLYADAGDYVALVGTVPAPGQVQVRALTGCRDPAGSDVAEPVTAPGSAALTAVSAVFARLGARSGAPRDVAVLDCGGGRSVRAVQAVAGPGRVGSPLGDALVGLSTDPVASGPTVYAYRSERVDVVVRRTAEGVTVTATTRCLG
jgi:hypothetical protein